MPNRSVRRREGKIRAKTVQSPRSTGGVGLDRSYISSDFPPILAPTAINMEQTSKTEVTVQFVQNNVVFCQVLPAEDWRRFIADLEIVLDKVKGIGDGLSVPQDSLPSGLVIADRIPNG